MSYSNLLLKIINTLPKFDCIDDDGNNICHQIASYGDYNFFKKLYKSNNPKWENILNQRNYQGKTPLHIAVKNDKQKLAEQFIKLGADTNIIDVEGKSCKNDMSGGGNKNKIIKGKRNI